MHAILSLFHTHTTLKQTCAGGLISCKGVALESLINFGAGGDLIICE